MEDYMVRLITERDELEIKLNKLKNALDNKAVPDLAVPILSEQKSAMENYLRILNIRVG